MSYRNPNELKHDLLHYANKRKTFTQVWKIISYDYCPKLLADNRDGIELAYNSMIEYKDLRSTRYGKV